MQQNQPVLGYWKIRGLAQQIRSLFAYCNVDYENLYYEQAGAPSFDRSVWNDHKPEMDFPNLPYLFDGQLKISETLAIMKYIAGKYRPELLGTFNQLAQGLVQQALYDQIEGVIRDIKMATTMPQYTQDSLQVVQDLYYTRLERISRYLGEKDWLLGSLSVNDFYFAEILESGMFFTQNELGTRYPNLDRYVQRFRNLEGVKQCYESHESYQFQFNNKSAKINN